MKNKITKLIIIFLLLIPFRLPVSVLFVKGLNAIAGFASAEIPIETLAVNVILTKAIYNIALAAWFIYTMEMLSREAIGRKAREKEWRGDYQDRICYWWVVPIGILLTAFVIVDAIAVHAIFYS